MAATPRQELLRSLLSSLLHLGLAEKALEPIRDRWLEARLEQRHHLGSPVRAPGRRAAGKRAKAADHRACAKRPGGQRIGGPPLPPRDCPLAPPQHAAIPGKRDPEN